MKIFVDERRQNRKIRFCCDDYSACFEFRSGFPKKLKRPFQVMDDVGQRDDIETSVGNGFTFVDVMTIKHVINIIQIKDVAREHGWIKMLQRRDAATDLQHI